MSLTAQIAKQFRDVHFGGNWTFVNLQDTLKDVNWQQATTQIYSFNTIAALVYHINYYVDGISKVLEGGSLDIKDKFSFDLPPIQSQVDWQKLLEKLWANAKTFAGQIEQLPEQQLGEIFVEEKYGTWYRNLAGITEHIHYHLGQIVLIKKMLLQIEE
jgi:hypothetical protein